jgi:uncharacterized protein YutE (UPF0331/DUF86 family)
VNKELIAKHIEQIETALIVLEKYREIKAADLERSLELRWTVERGLEVVMQGVFDVAAHILASELKNDWDDYTTLLEKLGVHGVVPNEFAQKFKTMAGFRNILIHEYSQVDFRVVEKVLREQLNSFHEFVGYIVNYMERQGGPAA